MKHSILNLITGTLALIFHSFLPLEKAWKRIFYLSRAKARITGLGSSVQFDGSVIITGTAKIEIGATSRIGGAVELGTEEMGKIHIGKDVRINRGTTLFSYDKIEIGDQTLIGEFVTIRDANHGIAQGQAVKHQGHEAKAIKIGKDVWIGRGVVILPGVEIGDHAIIGANSVVTKSIPAGMIAVGSPAKPIRKR